MSDENRPEVPPEDYNKPVSKGGEPLPLLPDREWLTGRIQSVEYRVCMFNNQVQYMTRKVFDETENKEVDEKILDENDNPIPRREFNITITTDNYELPNKEPRKVWLSIGASLGDKAHLPTLLYNTLGHDNEVQTPQEIIDALKGLPVKFQLANKPNKDKTKPPYQKVIYDAVQTIGTGEKPETEEVEPIKEEEVAPETKSANGSEHGKGWPDE
jgi:hypothetical protein